MNIIRLTSQHRNQLSFNHVLLDGATRVDNAALAGMIELFVASRDKRFRDDLTLANLNLVKWVVGRYLYHWPETKPFEDDMVSEGLLALCEAVDGLDEIIEPKILQAIIVTKVKKGIEIYLNNNRTLIRASIATNYRRQRDGQELEYVYTDTLEERLVQGRLDDSQLYVDLKDSLDQLREIDKETFIDRVLAALEDNPEILESELTLDQKKLIEAITDVLRNHDDISE